MFYALQDALDKIAEIVNICLGPLGNAGFTWESIRDFLIQLCSTLIIFLVVKFFFWKPITNIIEAKGNAIDHDLEEAREVKERAYKLEAKLNEEYESSKAEVKRLVSEAINEGNLKKEEIINEAKLEAERRLANSKLEIDEEVKSMQKQIKEQIVDIAFQAASKIVAKEINPDKYLDLVDDILKEGAL